MIGYQPFLSEKPTKENQYNSDVRRKLFFSHFHSKKKSSHRIANKNERKLSANRKINQKFTFNKWCKVTRKKDKI